MAKKTTTKTAKAKKPVKTTKAAVEPTVEAGAQPSTES